MPLPHEKEEPKDDVPLPALPPPLPTEGQGRAAKGGVVAAAAAAAAAAARITRKRSHSESDDDDDDDEDAEDTSSPEHKEDDGASNMTVLLRPPQVLLGEDGLPLVPDNGRAAASQPNSHGQPKPPPKVVLGEDGLPLVPDVEKKTPKKYSPKPKAPKHEGYRRPGYEKRRKSARLKKAVKDVETAIKDKDKAQAEMEEATRLYEYAKGRLDKAVRDHIQSEERVTAGLKEVYEAELDVPDDWRLMYEKLLEYKSLHGDCLVPQPRTKDAFNGDAEMYKLSKWVSAQRQHRDKLKPYRKAALEAVGFVFNMIEHRWQSQLDALIQYKMEHGHTNVPFTYPDNPRLASFVHGQRREYKLLQEGKPSEMTEAKVRRLEDIGFAWRSERKRRTDIPQPTQEELWDENYRALLDFHAQHGHTNLTALGISRKGMNPLDRWAAWIRKQYVLWQDKKPSALDDDKVKKLNDLTFYWGRGGKGIKKSNRKRRKTAKEDTTNGTGEGKDGITSSATAAES